MDHCEESGSERNRWRVFWVVVRASTAAKRMHLSLVRAEDGGARHGGDSLTSERERERDGTRDVCGGVRRAGASTMPTSP